MITENVSTLKIHKLSKEQYERELAAGRIDETALYLTPDEFSGGSSVNPDWNQNDSSQLDFIKNRPFYETDPMPVTIAEGTIPAGGYLQVPASIASLTLGEKYTVIFDGTTYNDLTCIDVDGLPAIGSADFAYTDYPFVFAVQNGMTIGMAGDGASHTITAIGYMTQIVSLDRKYIAEHLDAFPGEKVEGKTYTIDDASVKAGAGAEVFNNYENNIASGGYAHAEGSNTIASGQWSAHAEGYGTKATASYSHAEGRGTTASGTSSHSEGHSTVASNDAAHAEGFGTEASGKYAHAEGDNTHATAQATHAEGSSAYATADYAHAEGWGTKASSEAQHVQGKFNVEDTENKYAHIVGNGYTGSDRSNAHTVDWDGNAWFKGGIKVGGTGQDDPAAQEVALKSDISTTSLIVTIDDDYRLSHTFADIITAIESGKNVYLDVADRSEVFVMTGYQDSCIYFTAQSIEENLFWQYVIYYDDTVDCFENTYAPYEWVLDSFVSCRSQSLSDSEKAIARANIGIDDSASDTYVVRAKYDQTGRVELVDFDWDGLTEAITSDRYTHIVLRQTETDENSQDYGSCEEYQLSGYASGHERCSFIQVGLNGVEEIEITSSGHIIETYARHARTTETWTFTLEDGSTVTKAVYVG